MYFFNIKILLYHSTDETTIVSNEKCRYKARILELTSTTYIKDYDSKQDWLC